MQTHTRCLTDGTVLCPRSTKISLGAPAPLYAEGTGGEEGTSPPLTEEDPGKRRHPGRRAPGNPSHPCRRGLIFSGHFAYNTSEMPVTRADSWARAVNLLSGNFWRGGLDTSILTNFPHDSDTVS